MKAFPTLGFSDATDYGGFDREMWPLRDMKAHIQLHANNSASERSERS